MPITVRCPNASCAKSFRLQDAAVGKTGKCPACGTRIVIPAPDPIPEPELVAFPDPDEFALVEPSSRPEPILTRSSYSSSSSSSTSSPVSGVAAFGVVRFETIGEGWRLFMQQPGTWILAVFVVGFASFGAQILLNLLSIPVAMVAGSILPQFVQSIAAFGSVAVSMAIWGVLLGGLYRMALRQIDGRAISIKDVFSVSDVLLSLGLASVLASLAAIFGFLCLFIPGWIVVGLFMLTLPAIVDRRMKATEALGTSWSALKGQWLSATVFAICLWCVQILGLVLCFLGSMVTFPVTVLAQALLYREFFPREGVARKPAFASSPSMDPEFAADGVGSKPKGRVPVWAWLVAVTGLAAPACVLVGVLAMTIVAARSAAQAFRAQNVAQQQAFENAFHKMEAAPTMPPGRGGATPTPAPGDMNALQEEFAKKMQAMMEEQKRAGVDLGAELKKAMEAQKKAAGQNFGSNAGTMPPAATPEPTPPGQANSGDEPTTPTQPVTAQEPTPRTKPSRKRAPARSPADPNSRIGAIAGPTPKANPNDVPALMDGLASEDLSPQKAALDALGRSKPDPARHDEVVEALKPLITDPDATIRASAAKAMSIWADSHDVPMLITALDDPDRNVRRAAMSGFARLQDERAAEPLARQLADSDILIHNDAVRVLRQMGPIAEPAVIKVLNSNSSDVRAKERACQVLQNIGTKDSIRALNKAAAAKTPVQRYAQAALKAITARQRAN